MTAPELERPLTERFSLDWANCGTEANYKAHYRRGEQPCDRCRRAKHALDLERKHRKIRQLGKSVTGPFPEHLHGTSWGDNAHRSRGEKPCEACREARNEYRRNLYRAKVGA